MSEVKGEKIFITGGAGFLGKNLITKLYDHNEITIYSRDEAKHYLLKKHYPRINFVVGDIRNKDLLIRRARGHSVGIFAASLKQIETCNDNHEESAKIIIDGAFNSRIAAEENNFKSACFISSDKSRAATTIYGAMKYVAGEGFIAGESNVNLSTIIYGNVTNSTGSIIPLMWDFISKDKTLQLYGENMTRFLLDVNDATDLVLKSPKFSGVNLIPVAKSFRIKDLFEIYSEEFGLNFEVTKPRTGEKIHEIMASSEEIRRMQFDKKENIYVLYPKLDINELTFKNTEYSSRDVCLSKIELYNYLKNKNFYK